MFVDIGPKLQYNLLCDGLPEDKQLREQLQISKLVGTREKIHFVLEEILRNSFWNKIL
jgi:hypothetical protein